MNLRTGASAVERGTRARSLRRAILASCSSSRADDHDRLRFLQHRRLAQAGRKKNRGPPPQPSLPAVRHAIIDLILRPPSQRCPYCRRRTRKSRRKSAKVVLALRAATTEMLVSINLRTKKAVRSNCGSGQPTSYSMRLAWQPGIDARTASHSNNSEPASSSNSCVRAKCSHISWVARASLRVSVASSSCRCSLRSSRIEPPAAIDRERYLCPRS